METRAHYIAVGGFVLTVIAIAFAAVLWIGRTEFSTQYAKYDIYFSGTVSGLSVGSPVLYNGIRVGQVTDIRIDPENVEQIRVQAEIEGKVIIKSDAVAGLETNLLSGVSTIQITGGTQNAPVLVAEAGHPYPVIQSRRSRLDRLYARAPRLLERLIELTENANQVLDEKNRKAFAEMLDNLKITDCTVYGVLTEYCVKHAAMGLLARGRKVRLLTDAIHHLSPSDADEMVRAFRDAGGTCESGYLGNA